MKVNQKNILDGMPSLLAKDKSLNFSKKWPRSKELPLLSKKVFKLSTKIMYNHNNKKHYAKGKCQSCYHKLRREARLKGNSSQNMENKLKILHMDSTRKSGPNPIKD